MSPDQHKQRARWREPDGSLGQERPVTFLKERGYILLSNLFWIIPDGHTPTEEELDAIDYLVYEWDFGYPIKREDLNPNDTVLDIIADVLNIIANAKVIK